MTEDLESKIMSIMTSLIEEIQALQTQNDQKSAELEELTHAICMLDSVFSKLIQNTVEQRENFDWLRNKFDLIRDQQSAFIELLENKLSFSQKINETLSGILITSSKENQEQQNAIRKEVELLREQAAIQVNTEENMEAWRRESLSSNLIEIPELLERFAADVQDAHQEIKYFKGLLQKFESDDAESRSEFSRLCSELIERQKDLTEEPQNLTEKLQSQEPVT